MVTDPIKFVYLVGDGVTTDFSYAYNGTVGFDADVADDVKAAILNPDGTRDTNPNFAVMQDTYGNFIGKIRFAVAPVANAVVYIYRATPQTQETEYKTSSGFDAKNVENDFDKLTKLVQETSSHARNKTVQLDMFQENVLKFILASEANQNQMLFFDFNTLTFRFTSFTKGQAVISSASASDDKTDIMLTHLTDKDTGLPYLAFSLDQGATWKPMNFAEISAIVNSANAKAQEALDNSEQAVATANAAKNTADGIDAKAQEALDNSETAVSTANDAKAVADGIDAKAQQALDNSETAVSTANDAKAVADGIDAKAQQALDNSETNALEIKGLQGAGGALTAYNFNTATPTQETLTKYAVDQIWPGNTNWAWNAANPAASTFTDASGVARTAAEIFNSTWVNNTYDDHRWQLTNTQNTTPKVFEWADVGRDIVSVATATTAGIVRVGDGSQMVVNASTGDISLDGSKAESIRGTIGAVATNQGTANAGKVMAVGVDGNLVPTPASASGLPIGAIVQYCGDTVPDNFMWCDGSAISRTTYASLFAVIGTKYGEGDDRSKFKLPNFNRLVPWGGAPDWSLGRGLSVNTNVTLPYDGYLLVTNSKESDGVIIWYSGRKLMEFTPATTTGATNSRTMLIPFREGETIRVESNNLDSLNYYKLKPTVPTEKWIIRYI